VRNGGEQQNQGCKIGSNPNPSRQGRAELNEVSSNQSNSPLKQFSSLFQAHSSKRRPSCDAIASIVFLREPDSCQEEDQAGILAEGENCIERAVCVLPPSSQDSLPTPRTLSIRPVPPLPRNKYPLKHLHVAPHSSKI
jgi:hypothetical protein